MAPAAVAESSAVTSGLLFTTAPPQTAKKVRAKIRPTIRKTQTAGSIPKKTRSRSNYLEEEQHIWQLAAPKAWADQSFSFENAPQLIQITAPLPPNGFQGHHQTARHNSPASFPKAKPSKPRDKATHPRAHRLPSIDEPLDEGHHMVPLRHPEAPALGVPWLAKPAMAEDIVQPIWSFPWRKKGRLRSVKAVCQV